MVRPTIIIINNRSYYTFFGVNIVPPLLKLMDQTFSCQQYFGKDLHPSCQEVSGGCGASRPSTSLSEFLNEVFSVSGSPPGLWPNYDPCSWFWNTPQRSRWEKEHFRERSPVSVGHVC